MCRTGAELARGDPVAIPRTDSSPAVRREPASLLSVGNTAKAVATGTKGAPRGIPQVYFPSMERPPTDIADHAEDFAHRYERDLDAYCALRMEELGVPAEMIGQPA